MRKRFNRVSWYYCEQCGNAKTQIGKSIHGGTFVKCCGDYIWRNKRSIRAMNQTQSWFDEEQMEYAIAWAVE